MTACYEQLVLMDEVAGLVKRFMRGIEIDDESIALDVIDSVGPGGQFLDHEHTYQHFRRNWNPGLFNRASRESWELEGSQLLGDRATSRVRQIFETQECEALDDKVKVQLESVIQAAEKRVGK